MAPNNVLDLADRMRISEDGMNQKALLRYCLVQWITDEMDQRRMLYAVLK